MPSIPKSKELNATSTEVLNAIRNTATSAYRSAVPMAYYDTVSGENNFRQIGAVLLDFPAHMNEALHNLINRIGLVILQSKMYSNPWSMFKRGMLETGETIEEIFVNLARPHEYNVTRSESEVFKREAPDVKAAFHVLNYQKFYKQTIEQETIRQAFVSADGVTNLISGIINSMYSAMNYDEFLVTKYLIARELLDGGMHIEAIPALDSVTPSNVKQITSTIKSVSNNYEFMSNMYNRAGVYNFANKDDQYIIVNSDFDAYMDVEVLAAAFNMDRANFSGHRVLVDNFGVFDSDRLDELLGDNPSYVKITDEQANELKRIPAVLVARDWFMIFDNMLKFTDQFNGEGLYWNYWLHIWKTVSTSPYANATAFVPGIPTVTAVNITPEAVTTSAGQAVQLSADVTVTNFASKSITWISSDDTKATVSEGGLVRIKAGVTGVVTITATSKFDSTKYDTATITIQ